jgi:hypothetical protein
MISNILAPLKFMLKFDVLRDVIFRRKLSYEGIHLTDEIRCYYEKGGRSPLCIPFLSSAM